MKLNFKSYNFTTKEEQGNALIFDIIRKKYVRLTPEEWVRQHVIQYLIEDIGVPAGLISVERALDFNGLKKRFDICVASRDAKMHLLIECKAPGIALSTTVLKQAAIYNKVIGVKGIFLSNGLQHAYFSWNSDKEVFEQKATIPQFQNWI